MFLAYKSRPGSVYPELKEAMRAHILGLLLHFVAGIALALFLLPEGPATVLAAAAAAAGVKAFYDYLKRGVNVLACVSLMLGAAVVLLATV